MITIMPTTKNMMTGKTTLIIKVAIAAPPIPPSVNMSMRENVIKFMNTKAVKTANPRKIKFMKVSNNYVIAMIIYNCVSISRANIR